MIRHASRFLFTLAALMLFPLSQSYADVILDIADVTTTAGSAVSVDIFATSTDPLVELVGADIPIDIGGDGLGTPAGLNFVGFTSAFATEISGGGPPSEDVFAGGFTFGGAPTALPNAIVTLNFTVDSSVAAGTVFDIDFLDPTFSGLNTLSVTDSNFISSTPQAIDGSITIVEVPEPGSAAVLLAVGGVLVSRRKRR